MSKKSKEIFKKIEDEKIKPIPKWHFLLKRSFIWVFALISLIIGSFAFSVVLYIILNKDWDIYRYLDQSFFNFIILSLPYLWLVVICTMVVLVYFNIKHTKKGYRFSPYFIIALSVILSLLFGGALYSFGLGEKTDSILDKSVPYYRNYHSLQGQRQKIWSQPKRGLIGGEILETDQDLIKIKDLKDKVWEVDIKDALIKGPLKVEKGNKVKIIGDPVNDDKFKAKEIRPWMPRPGKEMFRNKRNLPLFSPKRPGF